MEALSLFERLGFAVSCTYVLLNQATLDLQKGQPRSAHERVVKGFHYAAKAASQGNLRLPSHLLATAAAVAARTGCSARAARLFASADRIIEESGVSLLLSERRDRELATGNEAWAADLSPEERRAAQEIGYTDSLDEAIAYACQFPNDNPD